MFWSRLLTIRVNSYRKQNTAKEHMEFKTVELLDIVKQKAIDRQKFIQSVVDNLRLRLCEPDEADAQILNDCLIFDTHRYLANVA